MKSRNINAKLLLNRVLTGPLAMFNTPQLKDVAQGVEATNVRIMKEAAAVRFKSNLVWGEYPIAKSPARRMIRVCIRANRGGTRLAQTRCQQDPNRNQNERAIMLNKAKILKGYRLDSRDGEIGRSEISISMTDTELNSRT